MMKRGVRHAQPHDPPQMDGRDLEALVEQMQAMVPHYTPEWRFSPEDPDAGTALFFLVADMVLENIKRLNRVPFDHYISFLDMLEVRLRPARPARATVTFSLNTGAKEPVYVPAGTSLSASATDGGEDVPFETEAALLVTPARLTDWVNVSPERDRIALMSEDCEQLESADGEPLALFATLGDNLQEHVLYVRHDELFLLDHPAEIVLAWSNAERRYVESELAQAMSSELLVWEWFGEDGWQPFERVVSVRNETSLWKNKKGPLLRTEVHGQEGRWIRCRLREGAGGGQALRDLPALTRMDARASHHAELDEAGIAPLVLYGNDVELDGSGFHPFGEHVLPYAVFYMACPEAFSKKGSRVTLRFAAKHKANEWRNAPDPEIRWKMIMRTDDFRKKPPQRIYIRKVQWEYWNGEGWSRLPDSGVYETMFTELPEEESAGRMIEFICPEDWSPTFVNGGEDWWLRARVLSTDPMTEPVVEFMSPWLEKMSFSYRYTPDAALLPEQVYALNNADWLDHTTTVRQGGTPFRAFVPIDCPSPAAYFGFDIPPLKGPIRVQFTLGRLAELGGAQPWIEWEICAMEGKERVWKPLRVHDETRGFTQSGALQFVGPSEMSVVRMFGRERAWLRAVNRDGQFGKLAERELPTMRRVERNAVPVVQQLSITGELPEAAGDEFVLSRTPIIANEVWVDETGFIGEQALLELEQETYEAVRDSSGKLTQVWVRWEVVSSFVGSAPSDRHYVLDSASGRLRFGDGTKGAELPRGGSGHVRVNYRITEGARGNAEALEIANLVQPIAFINEIRNSEPAVGGGDAETLGQAVRRGPQQLKHQGRAVSAADVEWIVRESEPSIARVRCLAGSESEASTDRTDGQLTVVAMPYGGREALAHFPEIKRRIDRVLKQRASNLVIRQLDVRAPALLAVSVHAIVGVASEELLIPVENACAQQLDQFLNTMSGQVDGRGWDIGEPIHPSALYGPLHAVRGVETVEQLHLSIICYDNGDEKEIPLSSLQHMPHGLVSAGKHHITVRLVDN